ncbi:small secreted hydrophilic protein [Streptomyces sp. NBC_01381]|uniref:small secreted hydrophilic protein n=1 Tax=Streptomyces sp. NBC_01381 TaxID=2903845 RepID=UPI0022553A97|nr:small secreted hydrophilic protein [Streptomyces sp. NBC_01381]MCX4667761.1 small secreted hydrophilic protein [Streptomyces sp. NBC_01381]
MVFSHRMAALAAVVAIPLGIATTSYVLTDSPEPPKAPPKVELESGSPSSKPSSPPSKPATPRPTPSDETVSPPPVSENSPGDDNDDDGNEGSGRGDNDDDGPGDDG